MSSVSAIVVVLIFLMYPISLGVRIPEISDSGWKILGAMLATWLLLCLCLSLLVKLVTLSFPGEHWEALERWLDQLVWAIHPWQSLRFVLLLSTVGLLLAGICLVAANLIWNLSLSIERNTMILVFFALIVEIGRVWEAAARDERVWARQNTARQSGVAL